jgi:hypothetical protein
MKKIFLIGTIVTIVVGVTSCKKDISLDPIFFQPTTYTSEAQIVSQLAAIYNPLETDQLYAQGLWGYLEAGADECFRSGTTASSIFTELYNIASTETNIGTFWRGLYGGIERANIVINVAPTISMDSLKRANIIAQSKFLRAYYYYLLVSRFGGLDGVPIKSQLTTDMGTTFSIPRTSTDSVYKFIIREMTEAEAVIPAINAPQSWQTSGTTPTVVSKSAVQAILVRVCMSAAGNPLNDKSKYQLALTWANKLISSNLHALNGTGSAIYPGTPAYAKVFINNVQNNFYETNATEDIWEAAFLSKSNSSGTYSGSGYLVTQTLGAIMGIYNQDASATSANGYGAGTYRAHNKLYKLYAPGDLRRDWAIAPYLFKSTSTAANPTKYFSLTVNITGGGGTSAAATAYTSATGAITSVVIDNPGSGYTTAPTITFTGYPTSTAATTVGTGAAATATVSGGKLTAINVTAGGSAYPTVYDRCVGKWRREYELNVPLVRAQNNTSTNFPIIRYADVLLMAAEADLQVNGGTPSAAAVEYYNQVRRRAFGFTPTAAQAGFDVTTFTMQNIMDERSRELCFEGVRRIDLIRWGQMTAAMQAIQADVTANSPATYSFAASFAANNFLTNPSKYTLFPIPATGEIANNPAMTQNPGW